MAPVLLLCASIALVAAGCWFVWPPLAPISAGVMLWMDLHHADRGDK